MILKKFEFIRDKKFDTGIYIAFLLFSMTTLVIRVQYTSKILYTLYCFYLILSYIKFYRFKFLFLVTRVFIVFQGATIQNK